MAAHKWYIIIGFMLLELPCAIGAMALYASQHEVWACICFGLYGAICVAEGRVLERIEPLNLSK